MALTARTGGGVGGSMGCGTTGGAGGVGPSHAANCFQSPNLNLKLEKQVTPMGYVVEKFVQPHEVLQDYEMFCCHMAKPVHSGGSQRGTKIGTEPSTVIQLTVTSSIKMGSCGHVYITIKAAPRPL